MCENYPEKGESIPAARESMCEAMSTGREESLVLRLCCRFLAGGESMKLDR